MNAGLKKIKQLYDEGQNIYIYGAGLWARNVFDILSSNGINVKGFIVTKYEGRDELFGVPVKEFNVVIKEMDIVYVLGLNQHNTKEVYQHLIKNFVNKDRILCVNDIMNSNDMRVGYDEIPTLDITTRIGCKVDCKYCPQEIFLKKYYEKDKNRESIMSIDTLLQCVENMPNESAFQFAGFAEPFLNPFCVDMIERLCKIGKKVDVYTTLVGLNREALHRIMELPINCVCLHVADEMNYAKIPLTEEYYQLLEEAVNYTRKDGRAFVDMCNAQARPVKRVAEICKGKYDIPYTLLDRAGNLSGENLVSKQVNNCKISCSVCGSKLNKNELLPDGTVLLCCMDYGLKHVLGNLKNQSFEEIMNGVEMGIIKEGMKLDFSKEILCRSCSCANVEI